jgi:hypothetical protein
MGGRLGSQTGNGLRGASMRILLCDQIPIQTSVLNRFGEVGRLNIFQALEVGNGSGYL